STRFKDEFLDAPCSDFGNHQFVFVSAVDRVNGAELTQLLTRFAKLADDRSIQFHLVDFAGYGGLSRIVVIGVGVGTVKILMRTRRDTYCPRSADVVVGLEQIQIAIKDLNASVLTIRDVDVAFGVRGDRMRYVELSGLAPTGSNFFDEASILV